ncbi:hypothetical protein EDEG_01075 [Edhazardia aedis USNM 41457]|uniref:Uncharacterized protein n=1 Tax=Edhazardia aedis (strain USNM 41457) TaxID=1003232 RepID=J9DTV8_EDHAE|nr:hypothetical protein EDEG_01075 [Edhazardia aedis USNM 41457]|eukprot:EJW04732.1 hypothetical protein EDEG_01075 [Edhazardia aedis USNM 41457]
MNSARTDNTVDFTPTNESISIELVANIQNNRNSKEKDSIYNIIQIQTIFNCYFSLFSLEVISSNYNTDNIFSLLSISCLIYQVITCSTGLLIYFVYNREYKRHTKYFKENIFKKSLMGYAIIMY